MHPLLKDAFEIHIKTGMSVKKHLLQSHSHLFETIAAMTQDLPGFKASRFDSDLRALAEDIEGGIEMLEMLCDEMNRLFQFIPESEMCPAPDAETQDMKDRISPPVGRG